ncbi:MAG: hypothetical protein WDN67_00515 [Candidatus Moraniibacteriota bacterium]
MAKRLPFGMICRAWITLPDGTRRYAKDYGLKAFCFFPSRKGKKKKTTLAGVASN